MCHLTACKNLIFIIPTVNEGLLPVLFNDGTNFYNNLLMKINQPFSKYLNGFVFGTI